MQRTPFDIPDQMRQAADKSVEQAKKAFENFMDATQQAVAKAEGTAKSVRDSVADANRQAMAFLEDNIAASFDLAQNLVRARTVEEVAALQQEFLRRQMAAAAEQGKNLGSMASRATSEAMEKATPGGKK
jgi:phasin